MLSGLRAATCLAGFLSLAGIPAANAAPLVVGWVEKASLPAQGLDYDAKLDTGARTSSIHAPDAQMYRKGKKRFVQFTLAAPDGKSVRLDLPVVRISRTRDMTGPSLERPVVMLPLCVAGVRAEAEVNLSNRPNFNYALLIGRSFMAGRMVVDSARENLHPSACRDGAK